jgi:uncharacterized membrane protein YhfC
MGTGEIHHKCAYESSVEILVSASTAMAMLRPRNFVIYYVQMSDLCDEKGIYLGVTKN